jgi:hypothetical protein
MPPETIPTGIPVAPGETLQLKNVLEDLGSLPTELRGIVHDHLQLAGLELRLAGRSLMAMIAASVFMGSLLLLAWIALMGSAGLGLEALGLPPAMVMLVLAGLTLALAWLLRAYIYRKSTALEFPGSLRSLKPTAAPAGKAELR